MGQTLLDDDYLASASGFLQLFNPVFPDEISAVLESMSRENIEMMMQQYEEVLGTASGYKDFKAIFSTVYTMYEDMMQDLIENPQLIVSYLMEETNEDFDAMQIFNMFSNVFSSDSFDDVSSDDV